MLRIKYTDEVASKMKKFFESLSEKDRRRYAAIETIKLGNGGQKYISEVFGCDPDTIKIGTEELQGEISVSAPIRKPGGGKKND